MPRGSERLLNRPRARYVDDVVDAFAISEPKDLSGPVRGGDVVDQVACAEGFGDGELGGGRGGGDYGGAGGGGELLVFVTLVR